MSPPKEKEQVIEAINRLGRRVTVADVSTKTGLPLQLVTTQLNRIAAETGGDLQVATTGDIAYCFSPGFQNAYLAQGIRRVLEQVGSAVFNVVFYIVRISFGVMLIVSLIAIVVLMFILMTTLQRGSSSDDDRGGFDFDFNFNFFDYMILRDLLWWGTWSATPDIYSYDKPAVRSTRKGNFFLDCFSFLFGDGNPNAHLEERRWRLVAQDIKRHNGVVTAEQLAPFTGVNPANEYGVFPVLVRFDGRPEVTESGNIVYVFPSLQVSAGANSDLLDTSYESYEPPQDRRVFHQIRHTPQPFLNEFRWPFTNVPGGALTPVIILAAVNFLGSWWLFFQLSSPLGVALRPLAFIVYALVVYGTLFIAVPLVRWLVLKLINAGIDKRNRERSQYAEQLLDPPEELSLKLKQAQDYKIKEQRISQDQVVYTTEKDSLEQEFEK